VNCKEFPVHARKTNREVELEFHSFLTSALDAMCAVSFGRSPIYSPTENSSIPTEQGTEWTPEQVCRLWKEENL